MTASDGTSPEHVTVSWTEVPGASAYRVYRDGVERAEVVGTSLDDTGAVPGGPPAPPLAASGPGGLHLQTIVIQ